MKKLFLVAPLLVISFLILSSMPASADDTCYSNRSYGYGGYYSPGYSGYSPHSYYGYSSPGFSLNLGFSGQHHHHSNRYGSYNYGYRAPYNGYRYSNRSSHRYNSHHDRSHHESWNRH